MTALYADTSAIVGGYLIDETDHVELAAQLFDGEVPVITSELTRVEFASAVAAAVRGGRLPSDTNLRERFDTDCGDDGPITLIRFEPVEVLSLARDLVGVHLLRTLDALHLAVALTGGADLVDDLIVLTRDGRQRAAAEACGLRTR